MEKPTLSWAKGRIDTWFLLIEFITTLKEKVCLKGKKTHPEELCHVGVSEDEIHVACFRTQQQQICNQHCGHVCGCRAVVRMVWKRHTGGN